MKKTLMTLVEAAGNGTLVLGSLGLLFGSYLVITSLPGLARYVKISSM